MERSSTSDKHPPLRFVWHVGPMKTGTTGLQTALRQLAPELLHYDEWDYWILNTTAGLEKPEFFDCGAPTPGGVSLANARMWWCRASTFRFTTARNTTGGCGNSY